MEVATTDFDQGEWSACSWQENRDIPINHHKSAVWLVNPLHVESCILSPKLSIQKTRVSFTFSSSSSFFSTSIAPSSPSASFQRDGSMGRSSPVIGMVAKSCTTKRTVEPCWSPANNGINHLSTGVGFLPYTYHFSLTDSSFFVA